jgi:hypothetical protein
MKTLLIALLAFLACGFIIEVPEKPEQKAERLKQESAWQTDLRARFDLKALRDFLASEIKARRSYEDANLEKSALPPDWVVEGTSVNCGDWHFLIADSKQNEFRLDWIYETSRQKDGSLLQKTIILECRRIDRTIFRVTKIRRQEDEVIELNP